MLKNYSGNGKTIILDTDTGTWIRMKTDFYEKHKGQAKFQDYVKQKYFQSGETGRKEAVDTIYFAVTQKCNLNCEFCAMSSHGKVDTEDEMQIQYIREKLPYLLNAQIQKVVITGGEPFENKQLFRIMELINKYIPKEKITLQTNGILMDESDIRSLKKYVGLVEISIENVVENEKLKERMEKSFQLINKYGIPLSLSYVVTEKNSDCVKQGLELAKVYDTFFSYRIAEPLGGGKSILAHFDVDKAYEDTLRVEMEILDFILENQLADRKLAGAEAGYLLPGKICGAYSSIIAIRANGEIYPCINTHNATLCLGNLKEDSPDNLKKLLSDNEKRNQIKKYFDVEQKQECQKCFYKYFCNGFCGAYETEVDEDKTLYKKYVCRVRQTYLEFEMFYRDEKDTLHKYLEKKRQYLLESLKDRSRK